MAIYEDVHKLISNAFKNDESPMDVLAALSSNMQMLIQILPVSKKDKIGVATSCMEIIIESIDKNPNPLSEMMN